MAFFATEYTIHFDDTMAYGSHHFLTAFKFQCASREAFLFGERVFDIPGVREALDRVHLLTVDAYARNLRPAKLGDRVAILLSLEEWGRVSARFCYRVLGENGQAICAGFQNLICADASTQLPIPLPDALRQAMDAMREIEEPPAIESFRDRVLAGGSKLEALFGEIEGRLARSFLSERYPSPKVLATEDVACQRALASSDEVVRSDDIKGMEAWVFAGQAAFDGGLLSERVKAYMQLAPSAQQELNQCAELAAECIGGNALALVNGTPEQCNAAIQATPALSQVAIHLQNILGAKLWQSRGHQPGILMGHSFGEIAALGIGGCFDLLTGVRIVCMRVQALAEDAPEGGGLLVVACDRSRAEIEANLLGLSQVVVAGRNHETQTVLSGPMQQLNQLRERLQDQSIPATRLPSPCSFHHPQLRAAASNWLKQLRSLQLQPPVSAVYSPIGRRFIDASDDIAATLAGQLVRPFDLQRAVAKALQAGATRFVDCGSSGAIARLIAKAGVNERHVCHVETEPPAGKPPTVSATNSWRSKALASTDREPATEKQTPPATGGGVPRVAIVAHGCVLPGGARTPERLFSAIFEQRRGIVDQRQHDPHWLEDFYSEQLKPDRSNSSLTGRVDDSDITVPEGVAPEVFNEFSRAQKLLCIALQPCIPALEGAQRVLCLVGATADGFEDQDEASSLNFAGIDPYDVEIRQRLPTGVSACQAPHQAVQEVFDRLIRPGLEVTLVDAACASSLYTVALGMRALETDRADAVIAGGFFCPGPGNSCLFSQFRGTTATGCRPFDAGADGVVFSEGAALVALRRLEDARQLGFAIKATVLGAGLSSDGKSSSANVPQSRGQLLSLERCYANYNIDPGSIAAIEGHGTSTPVGDSTEVETLRQFFSGHTKQPIPLHSLKGLLGHAGWAAGTASVIAVCEYMKHGVFPSQAMHRQPSTALKKAEGTLTVPTQPTNLPNKPLRIAIDGFGFGGANAHLVLESYATEPWVPSTANLPSQSQTSDSQQLVFVAYHREHATESNAAMARFDRQAVKLPQQYIVLPELADDMDISQRLAVILAERVLKQLPQFDDQLRQATSFVLAMGGKTERGVEATLRILTPRLRRQLAGDEQSLQLLNRAYQNARPSRTYTLQCMMPNVAAGRAALLLNLNGPNFVVDAGAKSLEAAFESAALLLHSGDEGGAKLAIVATIHANATGDQQRDAASETPEYAASFAVTTRQFAQEKGLRLIASVDAMLESISRHPGSTADEWKPCEKVEKLVAALALACRTQADESEPAAGASAVLAGREAAKFPWRGHGSDSRALALNRPANSGCQIHAPIWVEKPLSQVAHASSEVPHALLVLVSSKFERLDELLAVLPGYSQRFMVAVLGDAAEGFMPSGGQPNVVCVDLANEEATASALASMEDFRADVIAAVDRVSTWDRREILSDLATDNRLCEFLFLVGQRHAARLEAADVELWGLLLDGWNGEVHPASGPIAGLLKSIHREFPKSRTGTLCTEDLELATALGRLCAERLETAHEQEIVYAKEMRLVVRLRPVQTASAASRPIPLNADSVVVATGGAKGVTAVMLEALLRDYGCTVIAIGRSPLEAGPTGFDDAEFEQAYYERIFRENPRATAREMKTCLQAARARWEAHQTIDALAAVGGHVEYAVADITDPKKLESVFAEIISRYGKIDLLLHGAGIQKSKRLQDRSLADFRETFSVKVGGLHNLAECCNKYLGHAVHTHVLTSAYSVFGNDGQHDYGAANQTLDRLCSLPDQDPSVHWSSIAWLAWAGIGMTRGSEYAALAKKRRLSGVDRELGQRLFRQVIAGHTGASINIPISEAEHIEYGVRTIPPAVTKTHGRVLEVDVELSTIDCLPFHKIRNTPTLPGAWILDLLVKAGMQLASPVDDLSNLLVENMSFARFVRFANKQEPNVRVIAEQKEEAIDVWMLADVLHPAGVVLSRDVVCASARIRFGTPDDTGSTIHEKIRTNASRPRQFVKDPYCYNQRAVSLSGPFDCLREIEINTASRRAQFSPARPRDVSDSIPALLLDAAWRLGAMYAVSGEADVFVPVKIGKIVFPLGTQSAAIDSASWEILSTTPCTDKRDVRWARTEVFDESGKLKLVVEDAVATRLL